MTEVTVRRTFDAAEVNPILNHPEVLPYITVPGIEHLDVTGLLADPRNVMLMGEGGGILFCLQSPGIYEVHTNFLPEHRGRGAIRSSLAAYRWMFTHTDCMVLQTKVPAFNKAAEKFCSIVGATRQFTRHKVWPTKDGDVDMSFWTYAYHDWVRQTPSLEAAGIAFHERLEHEMERHGADLSKVHDDESCHDRYVGVCAETIYGGQPDKAVALYNQWAAFSGYGQIALLSRAPVVLIDIGDALIQVEKETFKVIKCRSAQP